MTRTVTTIFVTNTIIWPGRPLIAFFGKFLNDFCVLFLRRQLLAEELLSQHSNKHALKNKARYWGMTRIRDFEGHLRPFFFFRCFHLFRSFHSQKFAQLFLKRANMTLLLERFSEPERIFSLVVWSIYRCFRS